jgi:hypothetical protein
MTAEAMMNINAWKLWALDGTPTPGTEEIVARLEAVLSKSPGHPGANHYYIHAIEIHAIEASPHPDKAIPSAERLPAMMPAAGHIVHMPAHIMQRVGRFEEAAQANEKGAAADVAYFAKTKPIDYYAMYTGHNYQFVAQSRAMQGKKAETIAAAQLARDDTGRDPDDDARRRLVHNVSLCRHGALRHVGRDPCRASTRREDGELDRGLYVRAYTGSRRQGARR